MTYTGSEFSIQDLFEELKEISLQEKISSFGEYKELVDNLVEDKRGMGFFDDNEDLNQIKNDLRLKWSEMKDFLTDQANIIIE